MARKDSSISSSRMSSAGASGSSASVSQRTIRYWRRSGTPRPWWPWGLLPLIGLCVLFLFGAAVMAPDIQAEVRQSVGAELNRVGGIVGNVDASGQMVTATVAADAPADALLEAVGESTKCDTWAGQLRCPSVVTVKRDAPAPAEIVEPPAAAEPAIAEQQPDQVDAMPMAAPAGSSGEIGTVDAGAPTPQGIASCNNAFEDALSGTTVRFRTSSAEIDAGSAELLTELANLATNCAGQLTIAGHTDDRGAAAMNKALSQARAEAVRDAFVDLGIDGTRISAVGYGEEQPIADNSSVSGRAANRRITISVDATE